MNINNPRFAFLLIFFIAFVCSTIQVFFLHQPIWALLYDSEGYFKIAYNCLKLVNAEFFWQVLSYILSGFAENKRLLLFSQAMPVWDLVKDGPVIIFTIAISYLIAGKQVIATNWQIGSMAMIICQALIPALLFLTAKNVWGQKTALFVAILALTYPAFIVNSGRMLSEIPAGLSISALLCCLSWFLLEVEREQQRKKNIAFYKQAVIGFILGFLIVIVMLSRPNWLIMPLLIIFALLLAKCLMKLSLKPKLKPYFIFFCCLILGSIISLFPWILCKLILTGHPSILVERHGLYNLWAGLNIKGDGWDVLPSDYVNNPEKFAMSFMQVANDIRQGTSHNWLAFFDLVLRKILRLIQSPWNDFQASFLGLPWLLQNWWHQIIILLSLGGSILMVQNAWRNKRYIELAITMILLSVIAYHFSSIVFISMSRYFYTAMPAVILIAGYGLAQIIANINQFKRSIIITLLLPTISVGCASIPDLLANTFVVYFLAILTVFWFVELARDLNIFAKPISIIWLLLAVIATGSVYCTQLHYSKNAAFIKQGERNERNISLNAKLPLLHDDDKWLILIDNSSDTKASLHKLKIAINGNFLAGPILPLWAFASDRRSDFMASRALAYSLGKDVDDLRQWWCAFIPSYYLKSNSGNSIDVFPYENNFQLREDLINENGKYHTVSIDKFSWTKGYFANMPGEMRIDLEQKISNEDIAPGHFVPRIMLVKTKTNNTTNQENALTATIKLPSATIDSKRENRIKEYVISQPLKDNVINNLKSSNLNAIRIKVSGEYYPLEKNASLNILPSICLIEDIIGSDGKVRQEYAPLAPNVLRESKFAFEEICPLSVNGSTLDRIANIRLICANKPWWEVLAYGNYKGSGSIQFKNITVEIMPTETINLDKAKQIWQQFPCLSSPHARLPAEQNKPKPAL
jgi:hypothetical protein